MKRQIVFPVFVESSLVLFVFLVLVNLVSLGGQGILAQKSLVQPQLAQPSGFSIELPENNSIK